MLFPEHFPVPTKVHFVSPAGSDVGAVQVDCIVPHPGGTSFYFGKSCVAILTERYLMIDPRQLKRSALSKENPFWCDPSETVQKLPTEPSSKAAIRRKA